MFASIKTLVLLSLISIMAFKVQADFGFNDPPTCASPYNKPVPKAENCKGALNRYKIGQDGFLVSPGRENQKSCYDCQIKLTSSYKEATSVRVLPSAALEAIEKIRKACPSGYGALLIPRGPHDFQDIAILSIEVGSGRCE